MIILDIIKNRTMVLSLAKSDFKKRFVGSYFGIIWMFVQPLATVLVYTLIFQVGFKAVPPITGMPYVLWLIPGIIPWFYFQDSLIQGTNVLYEYNFLVKKVVFNVSMLPVVKLVSVMFAHICFIMIMFVVFIVAGIDLSVKCFLIIYFSFALSVLALGIIYFTSAINVFFKDMAQIINILVQFGIWMAPIMYDEGLFINRAPLVYKLLKLNPIYYIVKGYRFAMVGEAFQDKKILTIYFWAVTLILFAIGSRIFKNLENHFSDVL
ncbi:MAG: ABC transporter permease [Lachnospiraceae bacterium]|nr:ABC transporter permease [Lachnospiraceae bacterium]